MFYKKSSCQNLSVDLGTDSKSYFRLLTLVVLLTVAAGISCGVLSPRQKCYTKNYCDSAVEDCYTGMYFIFGLMIPSSYTYPTSYSSETEGNDTFSTSNFISNFSPTVKSGSFSNGTDVDIFYLYTYSGALTVQMSMTGTAVSCIAYTRNSQSTAGNATIDGTFTSLGTLTGSVTTATLGSGSAYLYVVCGPGTGGQTYNITFAPSATSSTSTSSMAMLQSIFMLSCASARTDCRAACDEKHSY